MAMRPALSSQFHRFSLLSLPTRHSIVTSPQLGGSKMLFAIVSRGKKKGVRLYPHQFEDNRFGVSLTKQGPYIPLNDHRDIPEYLANGYSLHMSNLEEGRRPILVKPESIHGWQ